MTKRQHRRHAAEREAFAWSVNHPRTAFPLREDLLRREREILRFWQEIDLHGQVAAGEGKPVFFLHDGPPFHYAGLHPDQVLNKLLQDFTLKFRGMQGYAVPFIPGWGMHGLPPEIAVIRQLGAEKAAVSPREVRRRCAGRMRTAVARQCGQLQRLGVRADWETPYLTTQPSYEGAVLRVFQSLWMAGVIERGPKPVHWCPHCRTALSDAEVEAHPRPAPGAHVALPVLRMPRWLFPGEDRARMSAAAWTMAPWTLLAATAVALHPEINYALVMDRKDEEGFTYLVARDQARIFGHAVAMHEPFVLGEALGRELTGMALVNPLTGRELPVLLSERVTVAPGSGVAAVCPGADVDDFTLGTAHGLPVVSIVNDAGNLAVNTGPLYAGLTIDEGQHAVLRQLDQDGVLLSFRVQRDAAPQCWRCHGPVITRAIPHWFLRVEPLRERALAAVQLMEWQPEWGQARMAALLQASPDWCVSRQRAWGIPVPALVCAGCEEPLLTEALLARAADLVGTEGADAWWSRPTRDFLVDHLSCPRCGGTKFRKARDVFDNWFEAACSLVALRAQRAELPWPADLAMAGHDAYRGWFQRALLIALALREPPPFRAVVSHGFVLIGGRQVAETPALELDPWTAAKTHGAELVRWWAALADTRGDIRLTKDEVIRVRNVYRRVRAAAHNLLGHLFDFLPAEMTMAPDMLEEVDRWVLGRLRRLIARVTEAFTAYRVHQAAHAIVDFCAELTARYLPAARDRLRLSAPDDPARRAAQTACYTVVETLARLLAPLVSFTAEEIWRHLPSAARPVSPQLAAWPVADPAWEDAELAARWERVWVVRRAAHAALAAARRDGWISSPETAKVTCYLAGEYQDLLELTPETLARVLGVAEIAFATADDVPAPTTNNRGSVPVVSVAPASGFRCPRCGHRRLLGDDAAYPELCAPCAGVVNAVALPPAAAA